MSVFNFDGIEVDFPFEPYNVQKEYMKKVIECLQKQVNGVLESPTGTGKTLSVLCATLGWQQKQKELIQKQKDELEKSASTHQECTASRKIQFDSIPDPPKIIYASRTHTQLKQAVHELRQTSYGKRVNGVVIGSREQLCIHPNVIQEKDIDEKDNICLRLKCGLDDSNNTDCDDCGSNNKDNSEKKCKYYMTVPRDLSNLEEINDSMIQSEIMDIEDLVTMGKKLNICPYYTVKELQKNADIIFMPYNYVLMPRIRNSMGDIFRNSIVILDEAHNINKVCEDAASLMFKTSHVTKSIGEVVLAITLIVEENSGSLNNKYIPKYSLEQLHSLKTKLLALENIINNIIINNKKGDSWPGKYILTLLEKADITSKNAYQLQTMCMDLNKFLVTNKKRANETRKASNELKIYPKLLNGANLKKISYVLHTVFTNEINEDERDNSCYRVFVEFTKKSSAQQNYEVQGRKTPQEKTINYWCFSPAVNMKRLARLGIHSILLTSGTLRPIPALISELGIDFPVTLENGHVIKPNQVYIAVVSNGPDKIPLNSSYRNRFKPEYQNSLGFTIEKYSEIIPHGLLVFFPSYALLDLSTRNWLDGREKIWDKLSANKVIFTEHKEKIEFSRNMDGFDAHMKQGNTERGACFLAVCRGKVSEGLDFSNNNGRGVIITGLPYPPSDDAKVELKKLYLNEEKLKNPGKGLLSGSEWYELEASRAVNQAIGRVIRHRSDYGAILLCDERFKTVSFRNQISSWLRPFVKIGDFEVIRKGAVEFFNKAKLSFPLDASQNGLWDEITTFNDSIPSGSCTTPSIKTSNTEIADTPSKRAKLEVSLSGSTSTPEYKDSADKNEAGEKILAARRRLQMSTNNDISEVGCSRQLPIITIDDRDDYE